MKKLKKLNLISAIFILLAFVVSYSPFFNTKISTIIEGMGYFWFFAPPILCIIAFFVSIVSLCIKRNEVDFVLIILSIVAFFTTNFHFLYWITGYKG